jgi:hypothetical protein
MRDLNANPEIIIESLYRSILVHIIIPKHSHYSQPWRIISDQGLMTRLHHLPTPQTPSSTMEWGYKHYLPCLSFLSLILLDLRGWSFEPLIHFPQCTWLQTGCEHIEYTLEVLHWEFFQLGDYLKQVRGVRKTHWLVTHVLAALPLVSKRPVSLRFHVTWHFYWIWEITVGVFQSWLWDRVSFAMVEILRCVEEKSIWSWRIRASYLYPVAHCSSITTLKEETSVIVSPKIPPWFLWLESATKCMSIGIEYWLILLLFRAPHCHFTTEERINYSDLGEFDGKLSITDHWPHIFSITFDIHPQSGKIMIWFPPIYSIKLTQEDGDYMSCAKRFTRTLNLMF